MIILHIIKLPVGISKSTSGNSSKLDVSSIDLICIGIAAGLSRICAQSTPEKNESAFISSRHLTRRSGSAQNLSKKIS